MLQDATSDTAEPPLAAAIVGDRGSDIDALLADAVRRQQHRGRRVRGFVMRRPGATGGCAAQMLLVDVATGEEHLVSQPLGRESRGCRADGAAFARASRVLREALEDAPDLIVSNRFGDLEAQQRGGFGAELLATMARGVPLLTTVAERNVAAWQQFTGGAAVLRADPAAVDAWLERVLER